MSTAGAWMESAQQRLDGARLLHEHDLQSAALSQAFFAVFQSAKAVALACGIETRTYTGLHTELWKSEENLDLDLRVLSTLQQEREKCDYRLYVPPERHVAHRIVQAEDFSRRCRTLL